MLDRTEREAPNVVDIKRSDWQDLMRFLRVAPGLRAELLEARDGQWSNITLTISPPIPVSAQLTREWKGMKPGTNRVWVHRITISDEGIRAKFDVHDNPGRVVESSLGSLTMSAITHIEQPLR
jgi:hypothetical protein